MDIVCAPIRQGRSTGASRNGAESPARVRMLSFLGGSDCIRRLKLEFVIAPQIRSTVRLPRFGYRWSICALLFFATTINYIDRQVLSILAPTLQKHLGWSEMEYGHIVFAFQAAYAVALVLSGRLIDKIGTRIGYAIFVALWSVAAMAHAAVHSAFGFGVARLALGLTEAGNFPAAIKTVAEWFPRKERALATGIFNSGSMLGAIIAPVTVPWLAVKFGWQSTFLVLGATGFVWLALWSMVYTAPQEKRGLDPAELAYIQSDPAEAQENDIPWSQMLCYRGVWAVIVGRFMSDPIWWFFLFWLPKFLEKQHGLNLTGMGLPLVVIYTSSAVGSIGGGWASARLIDRNWSLNAARKGVMLVCALAVVPVFLAARAESLWLAVGLISLATASHCGWMANVFSLASDIFPKKAVASITGIAGMAGAVGGMLIAEFAGWLLQNTGSYWVLFTIAACSYILGWIIICLLVPTIAPIDLQRRQCLPQEKAQVA